MTKPALAALAADGGTSVIVLISKPPAPRVMAELDRIIRQMAKPVVLCCLGAPPGGHGHRAATLEDAAGLAVALARGARWRARAFADPEAVKTRLARTAPAGPAGKRLLGLFTGGTLAHEARLVLDPLLGPIVADTDGPPDAAHSIVDLGADRFTQGRPHPMIDPAERGARIREAGHRPEVGVLLVDVVLGRAAHPDPAGSLVAATRDARGSAARDGRALAVVASVVGTDRDPQGLGDQIAAVEKTHVLRPGDGHEHPQAVRRGQRIVERDHRPPLEPDFRHRAGIAEHQC